MAFSACRPEGACPSLNNLDPVFRAPYVAPTAPPQATDIREAEKAKNAETIEDSQKAQTAVEQALAVLKDFYAKAPPERALEGRLFKTIIAQDTRKT